MVAEESNLDKLIHSQIKFLDSVMFVTVSYIMILEIENFEVKLEEM